MRWRGVTRRSCSGRWPRPETLTLTRALAPLSLGAPSPELEARIWTFSRGNPFMVVEALRALRDAPSTSAIAVLPFPERVRELVAARFEHLTSEGRTLLALSAVIGHAISFPVLRLVAGLGEDEAATALEELVRRRVLAAVGDAFDFTHDRLQEVAYASLLPPRRQALHAAVGQALETLHVGRREDVVDRLAYHYARTGESAKAVEYLVMFAEQAIRRYAHSEAVEALRHALTHVDHLPKADGDRWLPCVLGGLANALFQSMRVAEIIDVLRPYRDRIEARQDAGTHATFEVWLAKAYMLFDGHYESATRAAERALDQAKRSGDELVVGQAHAVLGYVGHIAGHPWPAIEHARQAIARLTAHPGYWLGIACWSLGANLGLVGEFRAAEEALAHTDAIGQATHDALLQAAAAIFRMEISVRRGESEKGVADALSVLGGPETQIQTMYVPAMLGWALCNSGRVIEGVKVLETNLAHLQSLRASTMAEARASAFLGHGYLLSGRLDRARALAIRALEITEALGYRLGIGMARSTLGRIMVATEPAAAADALAQALATFESIPAPVETALTRLDLARLEHGRQDIERAAVHLRAAHRALAALDAPRRLEQAVQLARELGLPLV